MNKQCSRCKSINVRRSRRRNGIEYLLASIGISPYRCRDCGKRFFKLFSKQALGSNP
ncbi:MAG: hypothetical protein MH252_09070 [Thermosynechococcaceae cyanobacterium MS004]|nr:hypothetical protein [Thermosynechococcaceae cyanobacterium MS004]